MNYNEDREELEFLRDKVKGLQTENTALREQLAGSQRQVSGLTTLWTACAQDLTRLTREREEAPIVYGESEDVAGIKINVPDSYFIGTFEEMPWATHQARLIAIEEIKK